MKKIALFVLSALTSSALHASAFKFEDIIPKNLKTLRKAIGETYTQLNKEKGSFELGKRQWFIATKDHRIFASETKKKALKICKLTPKTICPPTFWFLKKDPQKVGCSYFCPSETKDPKTHFKLSIWYNLELGSLYWADARSNYSLKLTTFLFFNPLQSGLLLGKNATE